MAAVIILSLILAILTSSVFYFKTLFGKKKKSSDERVLAVESLNDQFNENRLEVQSMFLTKKEMKDEVKKIEAELELDRGRVYVLDFDGDVEASQVNYLKKEISTVIEVARPLKDKVVLRLTSPGGYAHTYNHAASELQRLRTAGIDLTICVDQVAASGGYLMACVGSKIVAAPGAIVGSIGVVASVPNISRLLEKFQIDYKDYTAGAYKRTVGIFTPNTPEKEQKFQETLVECHKEFKDHVKSARPKLDIEKVATGETWSGKKGLELGLVDELGTSESVLLTLKNDYDLYRLHHEEEKSMFGSMGDLFAKNMVKALMKIYQNSTLRLQ